MPLDAHGRDRRLPPHLDDHEVAHYLQQHATRLSDADVAKRIIQSALQTHAEELQRLRRWQRAATAALRKLEQRLTQLEGSQATHDDGAPRVP